MTVTIQIKRSSLAWEHSPKTEHIFKEWTQVSEFAYRLAKQTQKEVRVEYNGNGNYYSPNNADNFLNQK